MDILEKLEKMAALPQGSEMPEWLSADPFISWDVPLRKLFFDAAEEIKKLRADVVVTRTMGGFREIKQGLNGRGPTEGRDHIIAGDGLLGEALHKELGIGGTKNGV